MSSPSVTPSERWILLVEEFRTSYVHVAQFCLDNSRFAELRLKLRDDNTVLAIAKGYGEDGGPIVCFGSGYDIVLALMALDSSMQGGNWRFDKPWQPPSK